MKKHILSVAVLVSLVSACGKSKKSDSVNAPVAAPKPNDLVSKDEFMTETIGDLIFTIPKAWNEYDVTHISSEGSNLSYFAYEYLPDSLVSEDGLASMTLQVEAKNCKSAKDDLDAVNQELINDGLLSYGVKPKFDGDIFQLEFHKNGYDRLSYAKGIRDGRCGVMHIEHKLGQALTKDSEMKLEIMAKSMRAKN